jgi:adenosylcobinamide kinase/adenosylcobinamide-phosphate guanylyltransferase
VTGSELVSATRGSLVLVTGGARSGKSAFAERLAASCGGGVLYVATAEAGDAEMAARIAAHRARRPADWITLEEPLEPARAVRAHAGSERTVLLDCLGLLVSNVLLAESEVGEPAGRLMRLGEELIALAETGGRDVILVSAEVGGGLVPTSALARRFRDLLGDLNQQVASAADQTYLVVAGLAVDLRALATAPPAVSPPS